MIIVAVIIVIILSIVPITIIIVVILIVIIVTIVTIAIIVIIVIIVINVILIIITAIINIILATPKAQVPFIGVYEYCFSNASLHHYSTIPNASIPVLGTLDPSHKDCDSTYKGQNPKHYTP